MLTDNTKAAQSALADYCRGTFNGEVPSVSTERAETYRELIQNVFSDTLSRAYPIAQSALSQSDWNMLVHEFVSTAKPSSPHLWHMPKEFFQFVCEGNYAEKLQAPWLPDLLHFEWLEIEVYLMEDLPMPNVVRSNEFANNHLVINPHQRIVEFRYPIFKSSVVDALSQKGFYHVCVYRHPETMKVQFCELSSLGTFWLRSLAESPKKMDSLLADAETQFGLPSTKLKPQAKEFFQKLYDDAVIFGYTED